MFNIYLRDNKRCIHQSFSTNDINQAMNAFNVLVYKKELDGEKLIAVLKYKNHYLAFHRFDVPAYHKNNLRGRTNDIYETLCLIEKWNRIVGHRNTEIKNFIFI